MGSPLTVGEECTIGHNVVLHGCTIGEGSLIGMGAIVLNGARIGAAAWSARGALVTEGKTFDDHSLIMGSPARATRTLDAEAVAKLRSSAAHYVANWRRFAAGMKLIAPRTSASDLGASRACAMSLRRKLKRARGVRASCSRRSRRRAMGSGIQPRFRN